MGKAKGTAALFDVFVNAPFEDTATATLLGLGIIVFLRINNQTKTLDHITLSSTEQADGAAEMSPKPLEDIQIPINDANNLIAKAIKTGHFQITSDWQHLFTPDLTPTQAHFNQAGAGIGCSVVYPLNGRGALIFSYYIYPDQITKEHHRFMNEYAALVSKALERKKL